jgi:hypothetical protein
MASCSLYNLPKDILIKLLMTVENDTKRKMETQFSEDRIISKLWKSRTFVAKCKTSDCNEYMSTDSSTCSESCSNAEKISADAITVPKSTLRRSDSGLLCYWKCGIYACKKHVNDFFCIVDKWWMCKNCVE